MMLPDDPVTAQPYLAGARPHVSGKFIYGGGEKLYIRGVTYGTFRPDSDGREQHDPLQVARDFVQMREASPILTVRLEDLWSDSLTTMEGVLRCLDLKMSDGFADLVTQIVYHKDPNIKYASFALPEVPRARRIMELYSY